MRTAMEYYGRMPTGIEALLNSIRTWLREIPDAPDIIAQDGLWSCHVVCRAVHKRWDLQAPGWQVVDGYFRKSYQHTWLAGGDFILDVYPVGAFGGPQLLDVSGLISPWGGLYEQRDEPYIVRQHKFNEDAKTLLEMACHVA